MQYFDAKGAGETLNRTVALSSVQRNAGITISSATVTASVISGSDDNPSALLQGSAIVLGAATMIGPVSIGARQAITQVITGGVVGVTYCLTFPCALSTGETWVEQVTQAVTQYVPTP